MPTSYKNANVTTEPSTNYGTDIIVSPSTPLPVSSYTGGTASVPASSLDAGATAGVPAVQDALLYWSTGSYSSLLALAVINYRNVSATNTAQQLTIDLRNLHDTLAIVTVGSGGTHTLTVEASNDSVNFIPIDLWGAVLSHAHQYTATTVGTTGTFTAVSPLAFRYVRISVSAAGVGFTTTLSITAK